MKKIALAVLALAAAVALALPATADATHADNPCSEWAGYDGYHPGAPGTYSSYNCSGMGGDYVQVNGRGRYSGVVHHTVIHAVHSDCYLGYCFRTDYYVVNHWHG